MRFIAELQLEHPELVLTPTMERCPEMNIKLEYQLISTEGNYVLLFHVHGENFEQFEAVLGRDSTVSDVSTVVSTPEFRVYRMRFVSPEYLVLARGVEMGLRLIEATSGEASWDAVVELSNMDALQQFRSYCSEQGVSANIRKLYRIESGSVSEEFGLTPSQRDALTTAYETGYFNQPRDTSLQGVADRLDISSSAAGGRLRRGLRRLVGEALYDQPPDKKLPPNH